MRYPVVHMVGTLALILAGCAGLDKGERSLSIDPVERGFELPPHPIVLFYVDGLRQDVFEQMLAEGKLPRLKRTFIDRAAHVRSAVVSVPSVTYANSVTMMTGRWPSVHGVWANVWFDRYELLTHNYEDERDNADLDRTSPTLFELMPESMTAAIALPFTRGVELKLANTAHDGGTQAGFAWAMGEEKTTDQLLAQKFYEIGEDAREIRAWPALIAIHLPAVDQTAHKFGSDGKEYRSAIENLDDCVGSALETFERGGMLEDMILVLVSDHGHHSTPRSLALDEFLRAALDMPVLLNCRDDGATPYVPRWEHYSKAHVVVTTCGEREASLHLRCGPSWNTRPTLEEILSFAGSRGELPSLLLEGPAIELVAVRAGKNEVQIWSRLGHASIVRSGSGSDADFSYQLLAGEDPLGYDQDPKLWSWVGAGAHGSREWLDATADLPRPDLVPQLVYAFDNPRSGDVVLFAAREWDFSPDYAGGHGGIEREEMIVPMYLAGPGIRAGTEIPAARLVDLAPTLLDLAGVEWRDAHTFDGESLEASLQ